MAKTLELHGATRRLRMLRPARLRVTFTVLIPLICAALSLGLFAQLRGGERAALKEEVHKRGSERAELLMAKVLRSSEVVYAIRSYFGAHPAPTRAEFQAFVTPALQRQPELRALEWIPRVSRAERPAWEAKARADGFRNFQFTRQLEGNRLEPAPERNEYFPVFYVEPVPGNLRAAGYDLATSDERRATLEEARDSGLLKATCPIILAQETGHDSHGVLVVLPIYSGGEIPGTLEVRRAALRGFALAVFRTSDLIEQCLAPLQASGMQVQIRDEAWPEPIFERAAETIRAPSLWSAPFHPPISGTGTAIPLAIGGRTWTLQLQPTAAFVADRYSWHSWGTLMLGLLLTAGLAAYLLLGARYAARIEYHVTRRTGQLQREIHERRRAEAAARRAEAQYRSIFENASEGIFQTTASGTYRAANSSLARMYGFASPEELMAGLDDIAQDLYVEPGRRDEFIARVQVDGAVSDFESQIRRRDGTLLWISENARAVRDGRGELLYYEGTVVDITARKSVEDLLRRYREELECQVSQRTAELAQANALLQTEVATRQRAEESADRANHAKSAFLATMTHELRTPLNAILGYSQLLARDEKLLPGQRRAVDTIQTAGSHLLGVINEVLDLSKIESGKMELLEVEFDLPALLLDIAALFEHRAAQKGVRLVLDMPGGRIILRGDEGKLRQVLINLLGNALKFTDSGYVQLAVARQESTASGTLFGFTVSDSGPGISPQDLDRIFQPFSQAAAGRARGGTGLGLAIARDFVQLMAHDEGSPIAVTANPGGGTAFAFTLPMNVIVDEPSHKPVAYGQCGAPTRVPTIHWAEGPSPELIDRILIAVETCSTTELKRLVSELPDGTPGQQQFRAALEERIGVFDYEGIRDLTAGIPSKDSVKQ